MKAKFFLSLFFLTFLAGLSQKTAAQTTWTVTSNADAGAGSLRQAIADAASGDIITFNSGITTITLDSYLSVTKNLTIDGGGNVTLLLAATGYRHIETILVGTLTLKGMTLTGLGSGSGIDNGGIGNDTNGNLALENCIISNCYAGAAFVFGGGIYSLGTLTMTNCTVSGNSTSLVGGGIYARSSVNLTNCTISSNSANGNGGGIYVSSSANLTNCTVSGNSASGGYGGGIYAHSSANLTNCTVSGNSASGGGGIYADGAITLLGSVVSGNYYTGVAGVFADEIRSSVSGTIYNGDGTLTTAGTGDFATSEYYIIGIPSGGLSALMQTTTDGSGLTVGNLTNHGGATQTIMPVMHSIMLDAVPAAEFTAWGVTTDQRGNPRPTTGNGTVGAVEFTSALAPVISTQPQDLTLMYGDTGNSLTVAANSTDGGTRSYQWYVNTTASNAGGSLITGATGNSFTPPSTTVGMQYYYVVVTNTKEGFDIPTSATTSNVGTVTVHKATTAVSLTATGGDYSNNSITLTVAVSNVGTGATPTGTITFKEGDTELAVVPLDNLDVAIYVVPSLIAQGIHTYTAEYSGDDNYNGVAGKSCTVDVSEFLLVSPTMLNFIAAGEIKTFTVACNNPDAHWTLGNPASWLTISSGDDHTMLMKADANPTADERHALVVFSIQGVTSQSIAVTQDAADKTAIESVGAPAIIVYSQNGDVIVKSDVPVQSVAVYDVSGKMVKQAKGGNSVITISGLPKQQVLIVRVTTSLGIRNYETTFDVVN